MRLIITFITVALVVMVNSSPVDHQTKSAPTPHQRRLPRPVKGSDRPVPKQGPPAFSPLELKVTKGTYVCGDKICRLTPGEIPKYCPQGLCQYPLGPMDLLGHAAKQN